VAEGRSDFRMAVVITTPQGGATTVQTTATQTKAQASAVTARNAQGQQANQDNNSRIEGNTVTNAPNNRANSNAGAAATAERNLRYPFTLLEIRENDEIPPPPPPPPDPTL
jgi:hypothetical protein